MKYLCIIFFLFSVFHNSSTAQHMEVIRGSNVAISGNVYDFYESEIFFKEVPLAYQTYQKALRAKKDSKGWGYVSLASLGIGLGLITLSDENNCPGVICLSTGQAIGVISVLLIFPLSGTIGIINRSTSHARLEKAAVYYNSNRDLMHVPMEEEVRVSLGLSQYGIGLIINF